jgi:EAL domain-containing protein (putative c-di-GMP-specific phosphodiesterase class I)
MQGYHLSRPMAADDFEALLVNRVDTATSDRAH